MRVWSVLCQKGGSGKTTLVLHVAVAAMADDLAVSVIDLDPQASAERWAALRETLAPRKKARPAIVPGSPLDLDGLLETAREHKTDLVLIDTPPAVDRSMTYAAAAADLVIVPTRSDILDELSLADTLEYLRRIGALAKTVVVLSAPGADKAGQAQTERRAKAFSVPVLATQLPNRVELAKALREGKGITEKAPRGRAAKEVVELYHQLEAHDRRLAKLNGRRPA